MAITVKAKIMTQSTEVKIMNLSQDTVGVLKNFASINPNIVMREGNIVKTISEARNILAEADISEDIPHEFGIYDLNEFLNVVGLFEEPVLQFEDTKRVRIADARKKQSVNYFFSDPSVLTTPQKDITMPSIDVSFVLTSDTLSQLRRASATLGVSDLVVDNKEGKVYARVTDLKDPTSNSYQFEIEDAVVTGGTFELVYNMANLKLIPGDYQVDVSQKFISNFKHQTLNVKYWVALEKTSKFNQ